MFFFAFVNQNLSQELIIILGLIFRLYLRARMLGYDVSFFPFAGLPNVDDINVPSWDKYLALLMDTTLVSTAAKCIIFHVSFFFISLRIYYIGDWSLRE